MAEYTAGIFREYVEGNAGSGSNSAEDDARRTLAQGARQQLHQAGWSGSDADYGVHVNEFVNDELIRLRAKE